MKDRVSFQNFHDYLARGLFAEPPSEMLRLMIPSGVRVYRLAYELDLE